MRFSITAVFALAAAVMAQTPTEGFDVITKPIQGEKVPAGSAYDIVWEPSAAHPGSITIGLLGGSSPQTLNVIDTIATGVDASTGTYSWKVAATLGDLATYGIIITLESDTDIFQYGFPFKIVGGSSGSTSTSTASGSGSGSATATASETESASTGASTKSSTKTKSHSASTSVTSTSFSVPSSTIVSSTIRGNLSTTAGQQTTITSSVIVNAPTSTKSSTTSIATNGVASLAAGSFAMLGGVAMAVFAL